MLVKKPKISVITVVYNGAKTIEQTILSVLRQAYNNIEYIIVDALSVDGTQQIVEKYKTSIAQYIREKDKGLYDAMNKGIRLATGDIVGIINSDDWYNEGAFEAVAECFAQTKADVVYGNVYSVYPDGSKSIMLKKPLNSLWYQMAIPHSSVFVKKSIYDKFGGFNLEYQLAADHELMLRFYSNNVRFVSIDDYLTNFRVDGLSMTRLIEITEEHKKICEKYSTVSPNRKEILHHFDKWYRNRRFCIGVQHETGILNELLGLYFGEYPKNLIIFGTGIWGNRCFAALKKSGIDIHFFADNDSSKWNRSFQGVLVINPESLREWSGYVLIASENAGEKIEEQLINLGNERLKCVTLVQLTNLYQEHLDKRESYGNV